MIRFDSLALDAALLAAVTRSGYDTPTAIQAQAIPPILEGRDVLGCAQTGTGKTAAFVLPMVQRLGQKSLTARGVKPIRALVLSPTRELASQIASAVTTFGAPYGLENAVVYGGVSEAPQQRAMRRGVDVLVATPGRLEDLMRSRVVDLRRVEIVVLDEADRMLDQGFITAVRRILSTVPRERQTLLFSATMPEEIRSLARSVQRDAVEIKVAPVATPAAKVEQEVLFVARDDKRQLLAHLLADPAVTRALVFTRTKRGADRVAKHLSSRSELVEAIHGDRSQSQRERALASFKRGTTRVLVATDLAARGIDVDGISHVINFELPDDSESYVHRIGRTGRAAASGIALSLCDADERDQLGRIERLMRKTIPVRGEHPYAAVFRGPCAPRPAPRGGRPARSQSPRSQSSRNQNPRSPSTRNARPASTRSSVSARPTAERSPQRWGR